jgi:hypothetical protein
MVRSSQHNRHGGSAPANPGFNAVAPEWLVSYGAAVAAPVIPAAESTLGSHPCVALSSAQVLPEWINRNRVVDHFSSNGANPLNFVSQPKGSLQMLRKVHLPPPFALLTGPRLVPA